MRREKQQLGYEFNTLVNEMLSEKTKKLVPNREEHVEKFEAYQYRF